MIEALGHSFVTKYSILNISFKSSLFAVRLNMPLINVLPNIYVIACSAVSDPKVSNYVSGQQIFPFENPCGRLKIALNFLAFPGTQKLNSNLY